MTLIDTYYPFDTGPGNSATQARWRAMARQFTIPGIIPGHPLGTCVPSLAGSTVNIGLGAMWIDGFYGEINTVPKSVTVTGPGQVVARMDTGDRSIKIFFVPNQSTPSQNPQLPTYEIPLAQISGTTTFTLADVRQFSYPLKPNSHAVIAQTQVRAAVAANSTSTAYVDWWTGLTFVKQRADTLLDFWFHGSGWASVAGTGAMYAVQITAPNASTAGQISRFYFNTASEHHTIVGGIAGWGQELVNARAIGTVTFKLQVALTGAGQHWYVDGNDWQFVQIVERMP